MNESAHAPIASIWITACIALHNFALAHEGGDYERDNFFCQGMDMAQEDANMQPGQVPADNQIGGAQNLAEGKEKREQVKRWLFGEE
jgi:hypothetical protein